MDMWLRIALQGDVVGFVSHMLFTGSVLNQRPAKRYCPVITFANEYC
jgi:hypothetical protein